MLANSIELRLTRLWSFDNFAGIEVASNFLLLLPDLYFILHSSLLLFYLNWFQALLQKPCRQLGVVPSKDSVDINKQAHHAKWIYDNKWKLNITLLCLPCLGRVCELYRIDQNVLCMQLVTGHCFEWLSCSENSTTILNFLQHRQSSPSSIWLSGKSLGWTRGGKGVMLSHPQHISFLLY